MNEMRLPHNKKEEFLYGSVICLLTVIVMLILNIGVSFGRLDGEAILAILKLIPIIWAVAMAIEMFIVGKIANKLVEKFTKPEDSFNTKILFQILFCVTGMSASMTILGGLLGTWSLSWEPFITFPSHWPRNFFVAFWCEALFAQPIARLIMRAIHKKKYAKLAQPAGFAKEENETL